MPARSKFWLAVAVLFTLVNAAGAPFAAAEHELLHTAAHVALAILGVYWVRRLWRATGSPTVVDTTNLGEHLTHLEQSVDAVAIEVERIGEGQRFMTRMFTEARPSEARRSPGQSGERAPD